MTQERDDDAFVDGLVPRVTAQDALVRSTVAGARARAARRPSASLVGMWFALSVGLVAGMAVMRVGSAPVVAPVVSEVDVAQAWEPEDEEADFPELDIPSAMDPGLDELDEDELASVSEELKSWKESES